VDAEPMPVKDQVNNHLYFSICVPLPMSFTCFIVVVSTEVLIQGFMLPRQVHLSHNLSPSCSGYFRDRVLFFAQASLDYNPPIFCFLLLLGGQVCTTMPSFFPLRWVLKSFFGLGWP
jgi:hypothetical protein